MSWEGKRYLVTGGSSGIGLATCRALSARGAEVGIIGRRSELAKEARRALGEKAWYRQCDVGDSDAIEALAAELGDRWPALDGVVNNAGNAPMATLCETDPETWDRCFAVNARGPYLLCRRMHPLLRKASGSAVVNVSSTLAEKAIPGMAAYNSAKAALNQLTRSLALEWAPSIRVNAVMPAVVNTPIHETRGLSMEQVAAMAALHPLGRVGEPEDIAEMIVFLLSDRAAWITGAVVPVDGGMMAG